MRNESGKYKGEAIYLGTVLKMLLPAIILLGWISCKDVVRTPVPEQQHDAKMQKPDGSAIYIDLVPNNAVMKVNGSDTGTTRFYSFRVGFADSTITDKKQEMQKQRYYDFEMEKDWVALVNGDSLQPVFFHPQVQKTALLKEFIMVFEVPVAFKPDTFIYKDRSRREINTIVLNRK